jgi:hypothetical protein
VIKGVNKQIIEIKCTNNEYFDRALLFVNSKCELFSETDPQVMAGEYLEKLNEEIESFETEVKDDRNGEKSLGMLVTILFGAIAASVLTAVLIAL